MAKLTCSDIVTGLRELGLRAGDKVLVHSSLTALGDVDGGAETVVDALIEAVGKDGLVVVPTFACAPPFNRKTSISQLGAVVNAFWQRPDAVRSLHPTHSVAAIGKGAKELVKDHEKAPTAYAEGTPYHKLATTGGKVLLLGVDQDRNTTLHTAEALAGSVYLTDITGTYVDDKGKEVTIPIAAMAGPHRDFIGLDTLFRKRGIMRIGKIGAAVCRLIDGGGMIEVALEALKRDPAAVLCNNPACTDCLMQRGKIKAARLAKESFTLAAVASDISDDPEVIAAALQAEGISSVEVTLEEYEKLNRVLDRKGVDVCIIRGGCDDPKIDKQAERIGVSVVMPVGTQEELETAVRVARRGTVPVLAANTGAPSSFYEEIPQSEWNPIRLAFSPRWFAAAGEKPFLQVFYRGKTRKLVDHFYIEDGDWEGNWTLPGEGNGEVKEIISMLRCRSYDGVMTIRSPLGGVENFRNTAAAFWHLLDNM